MPCYNLLKCTFLYWIRSKYTFRITLKALNFPFFYLVCVHETCRLNISLKSFSFGNKQRLNMDPKYSLPVVIRCDLCENHFPLSTVTLCDVCGGPLSDQLKESFIVSFKLRGTIPKCPKHSTKICKFLCATFLYVQHAIPWMNMNSR